MKRTFDYQQVITVLANTPKKIMQDVLKCSSLCSINVHVYVDTCVCTENKMVDGWKKTNIPVDVSDVTAKPIMIYIVGIANKVW